MSQTSSPWMIAAAAAAGSLQDGKALADHASSGRIVLETELRDSLTTSVVAEAGVYRVAPGISSLEQNQGSNPKKRAYEVVKPGKCRTLRTPTPHYET